MAYAVETSIALTKSNFFSVGLSASKSRGKIGVE